MAGFDTQILTNDGWDALADALAHQKLTFLNMSAGDGTVVDEAEMEGMTALKRWVMDFPITSYTDDGKGQVTLVGTLASKNVNTGFYFRELGVNATIDDGPQLLFSVSNTGDQADWIPDKNDASIVIQSVQVIVKIDRADNVVINVVEGLDVTAQNIGPDTVGPGWFRDKQGQILFFKRVQVKGALTITDTGDLVTIECPLNPPITRDTDLYVPVDAAKPGISFPTIQAAWDSVKDFTIPSDVWVTIHVAEHISNVTTPMNLAHVNARQINIVGEPPVKLPIVSINATWVTSGKYNWQADVTVQDASKIQVDDIVSWYSAGPAAGLSWDGAHKVVSKSGNTIRILIPSYRTSGMPISNINGIVHGSPTLLWYPSRVRFSSAVAADNIVVSRYGFGEIRNLSFLSFKSTPQPTQRLYRTFLCSGIGVMTDCAFCRGDYIHICVIEGEVTLSRVYLGDAMCGVLSSGAGHIVCARGDKNVPAGITFAPPGSVSAGCCYRGFWVSGSLDGALLRANANEAEGIISSGELVLFVDADVNKGSNYATYNTQGVASGWGGRIQSENFYALSNSTDMIAYNGSLLMIANVWARPSNFSTVSPPVNTQGNLYSTIIYQL